MDDTTGKTGGEKNAWKSIMKGPDRWLLGLAVKLFAGAFCVILLCRLPGLVGFILIPLVMLGLPIVAVALLILAGVLARRGQNRKAISVVLGVMLPIVLWKPLFWMADYAHLALTPGVGGSRIRLTSASENKRYIIYDWSVGLAGGPNTFLIYDPSDQITLPLPQDKNPVPSENEFEESCAGRVDHLIKHYYKCTF